MTIKLLFIPSGVNLDILDDSIKSMPIMIMIQAGLEKAYIIDTGIEATELDLKISSETK